MTGTTVVALSLALVGCSSADDSSQANAQPTTAASAAGAVTTQVCATADAANKAFVSTMSAASDSKGVVPPAEVKKALNQFAAQLAAINAADPKVATALKDWRAGASALAAEADPINANGDAYSKAGDHMQALCKAAVAPSPSS